MTELKKQQIANGLEALGLPRSAILMVHSSLSSLGSVDGGADAVIDALLDLLGPEGTLLMPTHPTRDGQTFDPDTIPSDMGTISETFRLRPGVLRSRHPYHPVAATGAQAEAMLCNHEKSRAPDGPETPYGRLISLGGRVLHIGCDLDTLTLLHAVEAELDLPYLRELEMTTIDTCGRVQTLQINRCPGGHRGGVLKFDRLFREEGAMAVGRIGQAVCRLISAPQAAAIMRREMARDPAFALDDNPHCPDCVRFRGKIKAARLAGEDFRLTAPLQTTGRDVERTLARIQGAGILHLELCLENRSPSDPGLDDLGEQVKAAGFEIAVLRLGAPPPDTLDEWCKTAARLGSACVHLTPPRKTAPDRAPFLTALKGLARSARENGVIALLGNHPGSLAETPGELAALVRKVASPHLKASYDPAPIAQTGRSPFGQGLYKGPLRPCLHHLDLRDIVAATGRPAIPGSGNAQIRETLSNLRCRTYNGYLCLWPLPDRTDDGFRLADRGFWEILDSI